MGWAHHWIEFMEVISGGGIMFPDNSNERLYPFDSITGEKTGALDVTNEGDKVKIELNPVVNDLSVVSPFMQPLDVTWHGAYVTFHGESIYPSLDGETNIGLRVIVEYPSTIEVN